MDVKENIRKRREYLGFSQEAVARDLSISQQAYQKLESGSTKIDAELMPRLAEILKTTVPALYGMEPDSPAAAQQDGLIANVQQLYDKLVATQDKVIELQDRIITNGKKK